MNFTNLMQESLSNDYNRLIELCSSYGLNEQQTNQIISDFKNGSFAQQDQSIDQSFQQSLRELDSNLPEDHSITQHQEYSFKHIKNVTPNPSNQVHQASLIKEARKDNDFHHLISNQDSFEQEPSRHGRACGNGGLSEELIEFFINQKNQFEKNIQFKLEQQNERLKEEIKQKQQKMGALMKMKMQDSEVILGLKESLLNLTTIIQEKDQSYRYLAEKYEKLKAESQGISTQKTSKVQLSQQESLSSFQERKSFIKQKEHCITQVDPGRLIKKPSHKYIKQASGRNNSKMLEKSNVENRETLNKNQQSKRSGIDISKYKGMIEKLRNSYQFR